LRQITGSFGSPNCFAVATMKLQTRSDNVVRTTLQFVHTTWRDGASRATHSPHWHGFGSLIGVN
jgi:hypothetical protein